MRKLMAGMGSSKPKKKEAKKKEAKKKAEPKFDADINKDGKVDEKDISIVEAAARKLKKIVKKKD